MTSMQMSHMALVQLAHDEGKRIGLTNGCFDLLHEGHMQLLHNAKAQCDLLIVAINDDESVKKLKGPLRPVQPLKQRTQALMDTRLADIVTPFGTESQLFDLIINISPDILFKGMDYFDRPITGGKWMKKNKRKIVLLPLLPNYSTTKTIALGGTAC